MRVHPCPGRGGNNDRNDHDGLIGCGAHRRAYFRDQGGIVKNWRDCGFRVEGSTNLVDWVSVTNTLTISSSFLKIIHTNAGSKSASFYRVIEQ